MMEKNNYSALWQEKRSQLHVDGDANADWLQMRSVLDSHMPVSGLIKKPYNPGRLKWIYKFFIGVSITATISGAAYLSLSKRHNDASRNAAVKESPAATAPSLTPPDAASKAGNGGQIQNKTAVIKSANNRPKNNSNGKMAAAFHSPSTADSAEGTDYTKNIGSPHRDSVFLPVNQTSPRFGIDSVNQILTPIKLNNQLIQKASTDSVKPSAKKRHKVGVFL